MSNKRKTVDGETRGAFETLYVKYLKGNDGSAILFDGTNFYIIPQGVTVISNKLVACSSSDISGTTTTQGIQFPIEAYRRKIAFFSNADNQHQFNGFGQKTGALIVQTHTTTEDVTFESGTSSSSSQVNLTVKGTGGIQFPTSGGTASTLNYYEEVQTHTTNFSGAWSAQAGNVTVSKLGKMVHITVAGLSGNANSASVITMATAFPSKWRPKSQILRLHTGQDNGAYAHIIIEINGAGQMTISKEDASGPTIFAGSSSNGTTGFDGFEIWYHTN